jgi:hypothetical protein
MVTGTALREVENTPARSRAPYLLPKPPIAVTGVARLYHSTITMDTKLLRAFILRARVAEGVSIQSSSSSSPAGVAARRRC